MTDIKKEEYVYVMSNAAFDSDVLKIGWSRLNPIIRAKNLFTTGLPSPFTVELMILTNEGSNLERRIHKHFIQNRLNSSREFFKVTKENLVSTLISDFNMQLTSTPNVYTVKPESSSKKQLGSLSATEVHVVLSSIPEFRNYADFFFYTNITGSILRVCESVDEIKELGIWSTAVARLLFQTVQIWKSEGFDQSADVEDIPPRKRRRLV